MRCACPCWPYACIMASVLRVLCIVQTQTQPNSQRLFQITGRHRCRTIRSWTRRLNDDTTRVRVLACVCVYARLCCVSRIVIYMRPVIPRSGDLWRTGVCGSVWSVCLASCLFESIKIKHFAHDCLRPRCIRRAVYRITYSCECLQSGVVGVVMPLHEEERTETWIPSSSVAVPAAAASAAVEFVIVRYDEVWPFMQKSMCLYCKLCTYVLFDPDAAGAGRIVVLYICA